MSANHYRLERAAIECQEARARWQEASAWPDAIGRTRAVKRTWFRYREARRKLEQYLVEHGRPFPFRGQVYRVDRGGFLQDPGERGS